MLGSAMLVMVVLLGVAIAWGVDRLVRPLSELAADIGRLRPDRAGERIEHRRCCQRRTRGDRRRAQRLPASQRAFVERERAFIDSASHELRTPIAVIAGAAELALAQPDVPPAARNQLARIQPHRARSRTPDLAAAGAGQGSGAAGDVSDRVALDQLLPEIVDDHRHSDPRTKV